MRLNVTAIDVLIMKGSVLPLGTPRLERIEGTSVCTDAASQSVAASASTASNLQQRNRTD